MPFTHFFFGTIGTKKKFPKRNAEQGLRALDRATTRGEPLLKKWTKQPHKASANIVRAKSKFESSPFKSVDEAVDVGRTYVTADNCIAINKEIYIHLTVIIRIILYGIGIAHNCLFLI